MEAAEQQSGMKRIASTSSMAGIGLSNYGSIYNNVWRVLQLLSADPSPLVADMARKLVSRVRQKVSWLRSTVGRTSVLVRRTDPVLRSACSRRVTTMWVNRPLQASQLGQLSLSSFRGR